MEAGAREFGILAKGHHPREESPSPAVKRPKTRLSLPPQLECFDLGQRAINVTVFLMRFATELMLPGVEQQLLLALESAQETMRFLSRLGMGGGNCPWMHFCCVFLFIFPKKKPKQARDTQVDL